ncbi:CopG family transcriptional regulator [Candidatus Sumerlaeota bacterium]|nr:CopG family transcriptional regulator [Candidatus Sumerlaeota bacterium]
MMQVPPNIEDKIQSRIAEGRYASAEEALGRAFHLLEIVEKEEQQIREINILAAEELDRGEGIPAEQLFAELRERAKLLQSKRTL